MGVALGWSMSRKAVKTDAQVAGTVGEVESHVKLNGKGLETFTMSSGSPEVHYPEVREVVSLIYFLHGSLIQ